MAGLLWGNYTGQINKYMHPPSQRTVKNENLTRKLITFRVKENLRKKIKHGRKNEHNSKDL